MPDLVWDRYVCVYIETSNNLFVNKYVLYEYNTRLQKVHIRPPLNSERSMETGDRDLVCRLGSTGSINGIGNINLDLSDAEGSRQSLSIAIGPCSVGQRRDQYGVLYST